MSRYVRGVLVTEAGRWLLHGVRWVVAVTHRAGFRCLFAGRHPVTECWLFKVKYKAGASGFE